MRKFLNSIFNEPKLKIPLFKFFVFGNNANTNLLNAVNPREKLTSFGNKSALNIGHLPGM